MAKVTPFFKWQLETVDDNGNITRSFYRTKSRARIAAKSIQDIYTRGGLTIDKGATKDNWVARWDDGRTITAIVKPMS